MRIVGGIHRGRRLRTSRGMALRPSSGPLRETLFNLIGADVVGSRFLDLCAGSGSVGIEALSRGAAAAAFVDNHPAAMALIRKNLAVLGIHRGATLLCSESLSSIDNFQRRRVYFDLAFLDPPYDSDLAVRCLLSPSWHAIMRGRKRVFIQHRRGLIWPSAPGWRAVDERRFGETVLTTFQGVAPS